MDVVQDALRQAIGQGAPAYNRGRPDECFNIYKSAASQLLESGIVPDTAAIVLKEALQASTSQSNPDAQAWTMRRAFDCILDGRAELQARLSTLIPETAKEFSLIDMSPSGNKVNEALGRPAWFSLDDVIMGGVSSSGLRYGSDTMTFTGNVTTDSNGGFASVRSQPWAGWSLLGNASGLRLEVNGDDRVYKISVKTDDAYDGVQYQQDFYVGDTGKLPASVGPSIATPKQTLDDGWQIVHLPFKSFTPNFRGRPVRNQIPLNGSQIRQLGIMVSKFGADGNITPGFRSSSFRLNFRSIGGFR